MVKMTSFEVIHTEGACNDSADSAEFSFLPIPPSTSPDPVPVFFDVSNSQPTLITATPDLTMEEVQQRLLDMLQENEELKEALKNNNVMMQEQLSIVSSWHEQMLQAKNKQQTKIEEADKMILNYQEQNAELTKKVKELESTIEENTKKDESLKESIVLPGEEHGYAFVTTKEKYDTLQLQLHDLDEKVSYLNIQIAEKDAEIALLNDQKTKQEEKFVQCKEMQEAQEGAAKASYDIAQNKLDMASSLAEKYKEKCDSLQQQMDEYQAKLEKLKVSDSCTIKQLQVSMKAEVTEKEQVKQKLQEAEKVVELLSKQLDEANEQLEDQNREQEQKKLNVELRQLCPGSSCEACATNPSGHCDKLSDSMKEINDKKHLEEIDVLTAKLLYSEQEIEAQQEKIQELQTTLKTLDEDAESIPILKAQVEVYKVDFQNEKIAKENAQNLVDALQEKMRLLGDRLSSDCSPRSRNKHTSHHRKGSGAAEGESISGPFICPFCCCVFPDFKAVQVHANMCADEAQRQ